MKFLPLFIFSFFLLGAGCSLPWSGGSEAGPLSSSHRFLVENEMNQSLRYRVHIRYPAFSAPNPKLKKEITALNAAMEAHAADLQKDFVREVTETFQSQGKTPPLQSILEGLYRIDLATTRAVSLRFEGIRTFSPSVGQEYIQTFNYDVKNGKPIRLADIFLSRSAYLATLSDAVRSDLRSTLGSRDDYGSLDAATTPEENHFSSFFLSGEGLGIILPAELILGNSRGYYTVVIPWENLTAIVDLKGPAGVFAGKE